MGCGRWFHDFGWLHSECALQRPPAMKMWVPAGAMVAVVASACGGEVIVLDENGEEIVEGWGDGGDPLALGCAPCASGDCGLCAGLAGADYRCDADAPPASGSCFEMGSLFADDDGHYVCWQCD